ncbi:methyltransferase domain-containing protein [Gramella sp. KN1008]|uniref:methyltransferase domain-containing protein n=1 Tax=Gramella sp. KN1008 TaxID=2529298 RepID=UPI00103F0F0E|nr:methyltransferase domain-containing protein [Gramella sp. KN1008]TBW25657.1 methyltransferase domain-containing protein [Gramella sp. KN1008]
MLKIVRKIFKILVFRLEKAYESILSNRRMETTKKLKEQKRSDIKRWKKNSELNEDWKERSKILAKMVRPEAKVIEFGAGNMHLKDYLPANCDYTPSDIYVRDSNVIYCDLNEEEIIDLKPYDTAIFSGVLEYVYDLDRLFKELAGSLKYINLTYACSDISGANRLKQGWLSDYTNSDLRDIFKRNGFEIVEYREWRKQSIYRLKKI